MPWKHPGGDLSSPGLSQPLQVSLGVSRSLPGRYGMLSGSLRAVAAAAAVAVAVLQLNLKFWASCDVEGWWPLSRLMQGCMFGLQSK